MAAGVRSGVAVMATLVVLVGSPASAQHQRTNLARALVPSFGMILGVSALTAERGSDPADLRVGGEVTLRHNGPWQLQVRLASPVIELPGEVRVPGAAVRVQGWDGTLVPLTTDHWITIATGMGTLSAVLPVAYRLGASPVIAARLISTVRLPVVYQVVPLADATSVAAGPTASPDPD